mmetsp:Transcript_23788/g.68063  ORF Transcript_23788/g.68063 Transcript_23788/m.68063 type:complete len:210 (+) Transcript_23788:1220-1849(+)
MQPYMKPCACFSAGTKKAVFVPQKWTRPTASRAGGAMRQLYLLAWFMGSSVPNTASTLVHACGLTTKPVRQSGLHPPSRYSNMGGRSCCSMSRSGAMSASRTTMKRTSSSITFHSAFSKFPVLRCESQPFMRPTSLTRGSPSARNSTTVEPPGATSERPCLRSPGSSRRRTFETVPWLCGVRRASVLRIMSSISRPRSVVSYASPFRLW